MSDTPITDSSKRLMNGYADEWVPRYISEELERERNQARKERDELKDALEIAWNHLKGERIRHDYVTCDNQTLQEIMTKTLEKLKEPNDPKTT